MEQFPNTPHTAEQAADTCDTSPCTPITEHTYDERVAIYNQMSKRPVFDRRQVNAFDEAEFMSAFRRSQ